VSDWRDDLPPIPAERIHVAVIANGARRAARSRSAELARSAPPQPTH
jgi:hypothetical protein